MSNSKLPNFLFVGNPGTGKSTLINGVIGEPLFRARPSLDGSGVTFQFDQKVIPGLGVFMDTPGLADEEKKHKAAKAITEALKTGGFYRIFFVLTELNGRCFPVDKATMKLILEAAPTITDYGIIVNQVHPDWLEGMRANPENMKKWVTLLMKGMPKVTTSIHFMPRVEDLANKTDVRYQAPQEVIDFIMQCPGMVIRSEDVGVVQVDQLGAMTKKFEDQIAALEKKGADLENETKKMRRAMVAAANRAKRAQEAARLAHEELEADRRKAADDLWWAEHAAYKRARNDHWEESERKRVAEEAEREREQQQPKTLGITSCSGEAAGRTSPGA